MSTICTTWFRRIAGIPTNRSEMYCAYSYVSVKLRGVRLLCLLKLRELPRISLRAVRPFESA